MQYHYIYLCFIDAAVNDDEYEEQNNEYRLIRFIFT